MNEPILLDILIIILFIYRYIITVGTIEEGTAIFSEAGLLDKTFIASQSPSYAYRNGEKLCGIGKDESCDNLFGETFPQFGLFTAQVSTLAGELND
jgi:hypothetical protein